MLNSRNCGATLVQWIPIFLLLALSGCSAIPTGEYRGRHADSLAFAQHWTRFTIQTSSFELAGYAPHHVKPADRLWVYIEGDGLSWLNASTPSADPTPRDPVALRMASAQRQGQAAYLARPCQFLMADTASCSQHDWTDGQFSETVISSMDEAITALKQRHEARELILVGYSGGGAVAGLIASRRPDVKAWVTVAGNLDHEAWTAFHRVRPLRTSLNVADVADRLGAMPQIHFIGQDDSVIPPALAQQWPAPFVGQDRKQLQVISDFDHGCCWAEAWTELQSELPMIAP